MVFRLFVALIISLCTWPVLAQSLGPASRLCRPAIEAAERRHAIPARLLAAIGRMESGRYESDSGQTNPWPWATNIEGQGAFHDTKALAVAVVNATRAKGIRSIDVGCMQVNLMHHPDAFATVEQAFDPTTNADYAARFLRQLFVQTGTWPKAAAWYHSATPELGDEYARKVLAVWPEEQKRPAAAPFALANAWGATLSRGSHPFFGQGQAARIIPLASAADLPRGPTGAASPGRGLDAYRAMPVIWALRPSPVTARRVGG